MQIVAQNPYASLNPTFLILDEPTKTLFLAPQSEYTQMLIEARPTSEFGI